MTPIIRTIRCPIPLAVKKKFSICKNLNLLIGPAPSQPVLPGELGYDLILKNMQFLIQNNAITYLNHADRVDLKIRLSQEVNPVLKELLNEQNASPGVPSSLNHEDSPPFVDHLFQRGE